MSACTNTFSKELIILIVILYIPSVTTSSFWEIENGINRQKWALAQELFRDHFQPAMYEVIVDKYKGNRLININCL